MKHKYINVNVDASYSEKHQVAGYAFHIHSTEFILKQTGIIKGNPKSSMEAELYAIEYALKVLKSQPTYTGTEKVMIFNDCMAALSRILRPQNKREEQIHELWKSLSNKSGKPLLKHVKGHTSKDDIASNINRWCDEAAREVMKKRIE